MTFLNDKYCIVGVGETEYSKSSGRTTQSLAAEAVRRAAEDAGLDTREIDGLMCYHENDSVQPYVVATDLGMQLTLYMDTPGGGNATEALVAIAASAIESGLAKVVGIYRALNGRSGVRLGGTGGSYVSSRGGGTEAQFWLPFGLSSAPSSYAMFAQRHMYQYGTTNQQMGMVAINARRNASLNPKAVLRTPVTMADYEASRMIVEPFRIMDCALETDGACALIVTSADRAKSLKHSPIHISGAVARLCSPLARWLWAQEDPTDWPGRQAGQRVLDMAGVTRRDIDLVMLYDCFTITVIKEMEDYGFCGKGEGGPFVAEGHIGLDGDLPVNPNGGLLAEAYVNGSNNVVELVRQLRGEVDDGCRGKHTFDRTHCRQIRNAEIGLSAVGLPQGYASALVLRR